MSTPLRDYEFELPRGRIAQRPAEPRDASRLLVLDRASGRTEHKVFSDLPRRLRPGDLLVLNDTKVVRARLRGRKPTGGRVEALLVCEEGDDWVCLVDARKVREGECFLFDDGIAATVIGRGSDGRWRLRFPAGIRKQLGRIGQVPLPPYVDRTPEEADEERYQTVYAVHEGSIAAPTAGLHFTPELLARIREAGVQTAKITLHVGPGTFAPVKAERAEDHRLEAEPYEVPPATAAAVESARAEGRRVVAVGTTCVRVLESLARGAPASGATDLFIHPPFEFRTVGAMVTNFHLPRGTPLLLVCALAGRERILAAYAEAIRTGYRFYSYGDAMFIS